MTGPAQGMVPRSRASAQHSQTEARRLEAWPSHPLRPSVWLSVKWKQTPDSQRVSGELRSGHTFTSACSDTGVCMGSMWLPWGLQ